MFSLVTWQMIVYAHDLWEISDLSLVLKIPVFLLVSPVAVCFLLFCLVLLIDFVDLLKGEVKK
jgi:TRAP-type C4-dicarboxylate transport system permease small subunit